MVIESIKSLVVGIRRTCLLCLRMVSVGSVVMAERVGRVEGGAVSEGGCSGLW